MPWYDSLSDDTHARCFGLGTLRCMAFSPDGARLATGGNLGATIWDHAAARVVQRISAPAPIEGIVFSPDGRRLALVSNALAIYLAEVESGALRELEADEDAEEVVIDAEEGGCLLAFHPSGRWLLCCDEESALIVDVERGRVRAIDEELLEELGTPVGWSADGALVFTTPGQVAFHPLDERRGRPRKQASRTLQLPVRDGTARVSPDGRVLVAPLDGGDHGALALDDGEKLASFGSIDVFGLHLGADRGLVDQISGPLATTFARGSSASAPPIPEAIGQAVSGVLTLSADGKLIAEGDGYTGQLSVYDWDRGEEIAALGRYLYDSDSALSGLAVEPGGRRGAMLGFIGDGQNSSAWVQGWDFVSDGPIDPETDDAAIFFAQAAFVPSTGELAVPRNTSGVELLRRDPPGVRELAGGDAFQCVVASPDGARVAAGGGNGILQIWDAASARSLVEIQAHQEQVCSVAWSPSGESLATTSQDGTIRLWSFAAIQAGGSKPAATIEVGGMLYQVCFSPDGTLVAAGDGQGSACVFRVEGGARVHRFSGHTQELMALAFHPGGAELVTGGLEGVLAVHRLSDGECALRRNLSDGTAEEGELGGGISALCFETGSNALWVAQTNGQVRRFALA